MEVRGQCVAVISLDNMMLGGALCCISYAVDTQPDAGIESNSIPV